MFKPQKQSDLSQRGRNRLNPVSKTPDLHSIRMLLVEADKNRGCLCELPIKRPNQTPNFVLTCQNDLGANEPIWTLYEGEDGSKVVWSYPSSNIEMIFDIVAMSVADNSSPTGNPLPIPAEAAPAEAAPPSPAQPQATQPAPPQPAQQPYPGQPYPAPGQQPYPAQAAPWGQPEGQPAPWGQPGAPAAAPWGQPAQPWGAPPGQPYPVQPQQPYPVQPQQAYPVQPQQPYPVQPQQPYPVQPQQPYPVQPQQPYPVQPQQPYPVQPQQPYPPYGAQPGQPYPIQPQQAYPVQPAPDQYASNASPYNTPEAHTAATTEHMPAEMGEFIDLISKRQHTLLLGHLFVEAGVVPEPCVEAALRLQEMVRQGQMTNDAAIEALKKAAENGGTLDEAIVASSRKVTDPRELARRAIGLLQDAGILSEQDVKTAAAVRAKHGGDVGTILVAAGKVDKLALEAASRCQPLLLSNRLKHDQILSVLNLCQRSRIDIDAALKELDIAL